ncbi:MAG: TIGR00153 family protein [Parachlamydiales bacterium]|nr:TIGR00153 family protein [Parachlamydiales bacterium]
MQIIAKIFGKSPFAPLQIHMDKVAACMRLLPNLLSAISEKNEGKIQSIAQKISKLEHEADLTKNDIRNQLPKSIFLPVDRRDLLFILSLQDSLADKAEDIGVAATYSILENYEKMQKDFEEFFHKNLDAFHLTHTMIKEFDALLESSFGGIEAEKVKHMIEEIAFKEHELDRLQYHLTKYIYAHASEFSYSLFQLWLHIIKEVGMISNLSENLANRIRMILELK